MFGLPTWAVRVLGATLVFVVVLGAGARLTQIWYKPQIAGMKQEIAGAAAEAKATKKVQQSLTSSNQAAETKAQAKLQAQAKVIIKKVPVYVSTDRSSRSACITNGMLRLHDAAVLGLDPADLPPPASAPDDACSTVSQSDFMATIVANYAAARENAEQLNSLEDDVNARIEAITPAPTY